MELRGPLNGCTTLVNHVLEHHGDRRPTDDLRKPTPGWHSPGADRIHGMSQHRGTPSRIVLRLLGLPTMRADELRRPSWGRAARPEHLQWIGQWGTDALRPAVRWRWPSAPELVVLASHRFISRGKAPPVFAFASTICPCKARSRYQPTMPREMLRGAALAARSQSHRRPSPHARAAGTATGPGRAERNHSTVDVSTIARTSASPPRATQR